MKTKNLDRDRSLMIADRDFVSVVKKLKLESGVETESYESLRYTHFIDRILGKQAT